MCDSFATCFEVVPEQTRPWKPEQAPQAMVTKRKGKSVPVMPPASQDVNAGCWIS